MSLIESFNQYRTKMNERILAADHKVIKRFFSLDNQTYQVGALSEKTKEMLGLVASMVLRCDDCIKYHLGQCHQLGVETAEIMEVFSIANIDRWLYLHPTYPASPGILGRINSNIGITFS